MKSLRRAPGIAMAALTTFAALTAACSAGDTTASSPTSAEPSLTNQTGELAGAQFDVRRDPG